MNTTDKTAIAELEKIVENSVHGAQLLDGRLKLIKATRSKTVNPSKNLLKIVDDPNYPKLGQAILKGIAFEYQYSCGAHIDEIGSICIKHKDLLESCDTIAFHQDYEFGEACGSYVVLHYQDLYYRSRNVVNEGDHEALLEEFETDPIYNALKLPVS